MKKLIVIFIFILCFSACSIKQEAETSVSETSTELTTTTSEQTTITTTTVATTTAEKTLPPPSDPKTLLSDPENVFNPDLTKEQAEELAYQILEQNRIFMKEICNPKDMSKVITSKSKYSDREYYLLISDRIKCLEDIKYIVETIYSEKYYNQKTDWDVGDEAKITDGEIYYAADEEESGVRVHNGEIYASNRSSYLESVANFRVLEMKENYIKVEFDAQSSYGGLNTIERELYFENGRWKLSSILF